MLTLTRARGGRAWHTRATRPTIRAEHPRADAGRPYMLWIAYGSRNRSSCTEPRRIPQLTRSHVAIVGRRSGAAFVVAGRLSPAPARWGTPEIDGFSWRVIESGVTRRSDITRSQNASPNFALRFAVRCRATGRERHSPG